MLNQLLLYFVAGFALLSIFITSRAQTNATFFHGDSASGQSPGLLTLVFSQVTTWIFARSLMNAAILGFYYGLWGTLAYAAYYLSFLTGAKIIDSVRFRHGFSSIQQFLMARFGRIGTSCYNFVIGIRLISEVFANLLVIGILFGVAGSMSYTVTILAFAAATLGYSVMGGLHASLRTDVFQMIVFLITLVVLIVLTINSGAYSIAALSFKAFVATEPGPVLLMVALLQVWSYPMHDPVMMDRGFLSDRETTRKSFLHAAWISVLCIAAFGSLGILAGANATSGEVMNDVLNRMLGEVPMLLFSAALVISAMSTLDSTLSSSSKLVAIDMNLVEPTLQNGRLTMVAFMLMGVMFVFLGNQDLFSAVAVSGTASMYLAPVIFFSLWGGRDDIPVWSYVCAFVMAITAAALYFTESSGYSAMLGESHKYTKLLFLSLAVLIGGCLAFWIGGKTSPQSVSALQTSA
jgi:Na+/proline symporter